VEKERFNLTKQGQMLRKDPARARALMQRRESERMKDESCPLTPALSPDGGEGEKAGGC